MGDSASNVASKRAEKRAAIREKFTFGEGGDMKPYDAPWYKLTKTDISLMRVEGCRVKRSLASSVPCFPPHFYETTDTSLPPDRSFPCRLNQTHRNIFSSNHFNTSLAILECMAKDTALLMQKKSSACSSIVLTSNAVTVPGPTPDAIFTPKRSSPDFFLASKQSATSNLVLHTAVTSWGMPQALLAVVQERGAADDQSSLYRHEEKASGRSLIPPSPGDLPLPDFQIMWKGGGDPKMRQKVDTNAEERLQEDSTAGRHERNKIPVSYSDTTSSISTGMRVNSLSLNVRKQKQKYRQQQRVFSDSVSSDEDGNFLLRSCCAPDGAHHSNASLKIGSSGADSIDHTLRNRFIKVPRTFSCNTVYTATSPSTSVSVLSSCEKLKCSISMAAPSFQTWGFPMLGSSYHTPLNSTSDRCSTSLDTNDEPATAIGDYSKENVLLSGPPVHRRLATVITEEESAEKKKMFLSVAERAGDSCPSITGDSTNLSSHRQLLSHTSLAITKGTCFYLSSGAAGGGGVPSQGSSDESAVPLSNPDGCANNSAEGADLQPGSMGECYGSQTQPKRLLEMPLLTALKSGIAKDACVEGAYATHGGWSNFMRPRNEEAAALTSHNSEGLGGGGNDPPAAALTMESMRHIANGTASSPFPHRRPNAGSNVACKSQLLSEVGATTVSVSDSLALSAGYYSFGKRLSLNHPNRHRMSSIPPFLGSFSHVHSCLQHPDAAVTVDKRSFSAHPLHSARHRRRINCAEAAHEEKRLLLQSTIFLRHTWTRLEGAGGQTQTQWEDAAPSAKAPASQEAALVEKDSCSEKTPPNKPFGCSLASGLHPSRGENADVSEGRTTRLASSTLNCMQLPDGIIDPIPSKLSAPSNCNLNMCSRSAFPAGRVECAVAGSCTLASVGTGCGDNLHRSRSSVPGYAYQQRYCRALTRFERIVRHVHSIDNCEREVDNESNDLVVYVGMRLMGWLEVVSLLGSGSFGQVFLCKDLRISGDHFVHPSQVDGEDFAYWNCSHAYLPFGDCDVAPMHTPLVAVKVVKSIALFEQQSILEAEMLVLIGSQTAAPDRADALHAEPPTMASLLDPPPPDARCSFVGKVLADGVSHGHHCIVMEHYGANLFEYIQSNQYHGLPMYQIRSIGKQLLSALTLLQENCHIIHADIKPENMLLTLDSYRSLYSINRLRESSSGDNTAATTASKAGDAGGGAHSDIHASSTMVNGQVSESLPRHVQTERSALDSSLIALNACSASVRSGSNGGRKSHLVAPVFVDCCGQHESLTGESLKQLMTLKAVEDLEVSAPEPRRVHALNMPPFQQQYHHAAAATTAATETSAILENSRGAGATGSPAFPIIFPVPRLHVKLIDFSSSCYEGGPSYTYVQSRYYRAPEVIVNASYNSAIDIWSTGCLLAELLLGMPLFPGCNNHHQLELIEEMVGPIPASLLEHGAATGLYYDIVQAAPTTVSDVPVASLAKKNCTSTTHPNGDGSEATESLNSKINVSSGGHMHHLGYTYTLLSKDDFLARSKLPPVTYSRYFTYSKLQQLVRLCPLSLEEKRMSQGQPPYMPPTESGSKPQDMPPIAMVRSELVKQRFMLFDLLRQLLNPNPSCRITAAQALSHRFFTAKLNYLKYFMLE